MLTSEQTVGLTIMRVLTGVGIVVAFLATGLVAAPIEVLQSPRPVALPLGVNFLECFGINNQIGRAHL